MCDDIILKLSELHAISFQDFSKMSEEVADTLFHEGKEELLKDWIGCIKWYTKPFHCRLGYINCKRPIIRKKNRSRECAHCGRTESPLDGTSFEGYHVQLYKIFKLAWLIYKSHTSDNKDLFTLNNSYLAKKCEMTEKTCWLWTKTILRLHSPMFPYKRDPNKHYYVEKIMFQNADYVIMMAVSDDSEQFRAEIFPDDSKKYLDSFLGGWVGSYNITLLNWGRAIETRDEKYGTIIPMEDKSNNRPTYQHIHRISKLLARKNKSEKSEINLQRYLYFYMNMSNRERLTFTQLMEAMITFKVKYNYKE